MPEHLRAAGGDGREPRGARDHGSALDRAPKVLLFANTDWYLHNFRLSLARALRDAGCEVVLASPPGLYSPRLVAAGFRWVSIPLRRASLDPWCELRTIVALARLYRQERFDLAHHFTLKCVLYGSIAAKLSSTPHVNAITGMGYLFTGETRRARWLRGPVRRLLRAALRGRLSRVIVQNGDDQRMLLETGLAEAAHIRVIKGSGVCLDRFEAHRPTGTSGRAVRVLLAARLLWDKGIGEYVEAARQLRREGMVVEFLLAGNPDAGNPASIPAEIVDRWRAEGAVRALGHVDDMPDLLRRIDVAVLPSYREGVPRSLLEAAACGLPLVATDVPGCREIVDHGVTGLLVPCRDALALAHAIRYLCERPAVRARMGAAGRAKVVGEFDEAIVIRRTFEVYRSVLSDRMAPVLAAA